jgi:hypothetical protein
MAKPGFARANKYLFSRDIWTWNLPSGYTCPGALKCLAYADRTTGRVKLGKENEFRCYSAVTERFPAVRDKSWANRDAVFGLDEQEVADVVCSLLPQDAKLVRIHAAGDMFSQAYFDGWMTVCRRNPGVRFWLFTKSLPFWVARQNHIPANVNITASYGGKHDALIEQYGLKFARVVYSESEAKCLGLPIDRDDSLAAFSTESFALLENFSRKKAAPLPMALEL